MESSERKKEDASTNSNTTSLDDIGPATSNTEGRHVEEEQKSYSMTSKLPDVDDENLLFENSTATTPSSNNYLEVLSSNSDKVNKCIEEVLMDMFLHDQIPFKPTEIDEDLEIFSLDKAKRIINVIYPMPEDELDIHIFYVLERLFAKQAINFSAYLCMMYPSDSYLSLKLIRFIIRTLVKCYSDSNFPALSCSITSKLPVEDDDDQSVNLYPPSHNYQEVLSSKLDKVNKSVDEVLIDLYLDDQFPFPPTEIHSDSQIFSLNQAKQIIDSVYPVPEDILDIHIFEILERLFTRQIIKFSAYLCLMNPSECYLSIKLIRFFIENLVTLYSDSNFPTALSPPPSLLSIEENEDDEEQAGNATIGQKKSPLISTSPVPESKFEELLSDFDKFDEFIDHALLELYQDDIIPFHPSEMHTITRKITFEHVKRLMAYVYPESEEKLSSHLYNVMERLFDEEVVNFPASQALSHPDESLFTIGTVRIIVRTIVSYYCSSPFSVQSP